MHELDQRDALAYIRQLVRRLIDGVNEIASCADLEVQAGGCPGMPCLLHFAGEDEKRNQARLTSSLRELLRRGVMPYGKYFYICYAHSAEDIEYTLQAMRETMEIVRQQYP